MTEPHNLGPARGSALTRLMTRVLVWLWNSPVATSWLSFGVRILGLLVLLPIVLVVLSTAEVAIWLLFSTIFAIQFLADFGLTPTFVRAVAYSRAMRLDPAFGPDGGVQIDLQGQTAEVIKAMRWIYTWLGLIVLMLMGIFGTIAVARPIAQLDAPMEGWIAWIVVAVTSAIVMHGAMYSNFLQGAERIANFRRWEAIVGAVALVTACGVLLLGGGLLGLVLSMQMGQIARTLVNSHLARNFADPGDWSRPARYDPSTMSAIWPAAWRSGLGVAATTLTLQGAGVVYAQIAPPDAVASYLLAIRIVFILRDFSNVPFYTKIPILSRLYKDGEFGTLSDIAAKEFLTTIWIFTVGAVTIGLLADPLFAFIGSGTSFVSPWLWFLIAIAFCVERIGALHIQLYSVTNHIVWHISNVISGLLMLGAMPIFYKLFGVAGFPTGALFAYVTFFLPYAAYHSTRTFAFGILRHWVSAAFAPLSVLAVAFWIALPS